MQQRNKKQNTFSRQSFPTSCKISLVFSASCPDTIFDGRAETGSPVMCPISKWNWKAKKRRYVNIFYTYITTLHLPIDRGYQRKLCCNPQQINFAIKIQNASNNDNLPRQSISFWRNAILASFSCKYIIINKKIEN